MQRRQASSYSELVYSTEPSAPATPARAQVSQSKVVKMRLEKRRGKAQVVLFELSMAPEQKRELLKQIQKECGCGGCLKDGQLEIQGDHRERIEQLLTERGFKVKRAGG